MPTVGDGRVAIVEGEILSLNLSGHIGEAVARAVLDRARNVLVGRHLRVGFSDATRVTGMDLAIQAPARELVATTPGHGLREVFCATASPGMRMLGIAVGLATGVRFNFFQAVEEAWAAALAAAGRR